MGPAGTKLLSVNFAYALMILFLMCEGVRPLNSFQILGLEPVNGRF